MACLRESTIEGRLGVVQCDEEGCEFRSFTVKSSSHPDWETSSGDCLLQLRLRAGDVEDSSEKQFDWERGEYYFPESVNTGVFYGPADRPDYTCTACRSRYWCHDGDVCRGGLTTEEMENLVTSLVEQRVKHLRGE